MIRTNVWVTTSFIGFHRWKDAPDSVAYLRDYHRHVFHVKAWKTVTGPDREVEFHSLKTKIDAWFEARYADTRFEDSCEMIALALIESLGLSAAQVSEDGENGAFVEVEGGPPPAPPIPSKKARTRCFVGTEAEGPNRGERTLFVPGSASLEDYRKAYHKVLRSDVQKVYYGAGNDRAFRPETLRAILDNFGGGCVTVELDRGFDDPLLDDVTVVSLDPFDLARPDACTYVKLECDGCYHWLAPWIVRSTPVNDPLYAQDEEL